ncbi:MAG: YebC/PmpR family DNA-binding transcriptional regulator, partial [Firmicutes bacterium]|nr:YebC/PmpR family DNA-binding transcriptional regulator [Candidatus Onthovivens merdipullorum]
EEELEEALVFGDVDVKEVSLEEGKAEVVTEPSDFEKAKEILKGLGITEFDVSEIRMLANERITLEGEDLRKFKDLLDALDDCEDVQNVYHNVEL